MEPTQKGSDPRVSLLLPLPSSVDQDTAPWAREFEEDCTSFIEAMKVKYGYLEIEQGTTILFACGVKDASDPKKRTLVSGGNILSDLIASTTALCIHSAAKAGWEKRKVPYIQTVQNLLRKVAGHLATIELGDSTASPSSSS